MSPSVSSIRLPAWTSPWKKPCSSAASIQARTPRFSAPARSQPVGAERGEVVDLVAVDALHGQDPRGGERPLHRRDPDAGRWPRTATRFAAKRSIDRASMTKLSSWARVAAKSSTTATGFAIRPCGGDALEQPCGHDRGSPGRRRVEPRMPGRWILTTTSLAVGERGGVDLGDRRRRERLLVEPGEHLLRRGAELGGDHGVRRRPGGDRRHLVEAGPELVGEHVGEQARARRDQLGQLHVGRAELLEAPAAAPSRHPRPLPTAERGRRPLVRRASPGPTPVRPARRAVASALPDPKGMFGTSLDSIGDAS